jgi:hypothetical protein
LQDDRILCTTKDNTSEELTCISENLFSFMVFKPFIAPAKYMPLSKFDGQQNQSAGRFASKANKKPPRSGEAVGK